MAAVVTAASRINRDLESDDFLAEQGAVFAEPRTFPVELVGKATVCMRSFVSPCHGGMVACIGWL